MKRVFEEEQQRQEEYTFDELDDFFEPQFLTFDVRVKARIHIPSMDSLIDTKSAMRTVKRDLRKVMKSQFAKELTKQINDQL